MNISISYTPLNPCQKLLKGAQIILWSYLAIYIILRAKMQYKLLTLLPLFFLFKLLSRSGTIEKVEIHPEKENSAVNRTDKLFKL